MRESPIRNPSARKIAATHGRPVAHGSVYRCFRRASLALIISASLLSGMTRAQSSAPPAPKTGEESRIERLEHLLESVLEENRRLGARISDLEEQRSAPHTPGSSAASAPPERPGTARLDVQEASLQIVAPEPEPVLWPPPPEMSAAPIGNSAARFQVDYDNGFVISPMNMSETPFSLKINSENMFRFNSFTRDEDFWIDSAGNQTPIANSNAFQIPRGRLIFSGTAFDPQLSYLLSIDYNTVNNNPIGFRAYELSYAFSRALAVHVGQSKVPGTREWLESAFAPLEGPDRTMATTFFRPSLSQGIWITGEHVDGAHYHLMMSNGFNTLNLRSAQLNDRFCWSGSTWWEPWGDFGPGYADLQSHNKPVIRIGGSYTFALGDGSQSDSDAVENSSIRLSDGTLITQPGAFAPGVILQSYSISLAAVDLAVKYRGLSLSTEWYVQDLFDLKGSGPLPIRSTQAAGGFVQGGYFIIPQIVEPYVRASFVSGRYGSGSETAGGFNWFPIPGESGLRFTFDTAWLESSPADQNRTGFVAGQTGLLIRTQIAIVY